MAGTKQKRIDELEVLLLAARPVEWVTDPTDVNILNALKWKKDVDKALKKETNEKNNTD